MLSFSDRRNSSPPIAVKIFCQLSEIGCITQNIEYNAVIHLRNSSYSLIEIKLGGDRLIDEGAHNLKTLSGIIDTQKMKAPSFLMILTGTENYAYRREDGIYVVPIGCLKN